MSVQIVVEQIKPFFPCRVKSGTGNTSGLGAGLLLNIVHGIAWKMWRWNIPVLHKFYFKFTVNTQV